MPRKKPALDPAPPETPENAPGELPVAIPVDDRQAETPLAAAPGEPEQPANGHGGDRRKPVISWRVQSDRTTSIELACWANTYRTQSGEEYEQLSFTVQRSYRDQQGTWQKGGSWRTHDLPALTFLIAKAHAFALDKRATVTTDCPF